MASTLKIFSLIIAAIALMAAVSADPNHVGLCSEARMPIASLSGALRQRHQAKTMTCQECCLQHGRSFDYVQEGDQMVCSCTKVKPNVEHRKMV